MGELVILIGFPASGKTHYCRHHLSDYVRISLYDLLNMAGGKKDLAKKLEIKCLEKALDLGFSVVVDRVNLTKKRREKLIKCAKKKKAKVTGIWFSSSNWRQRNSQRLEKIDKDLTEKVSQSKIEEMQRAFQEPSLEEGFDQLLKIVN